MNNRETDGQLVEPEARLSRGFVFQHALTFRMYDEYDVGGKLSYFHLCSELPLEFKFKRTQI